MRDRKESKAGSVAKEISLIRKSSSVVLSTFSRYMGKKEAKNFQGRSRKDKIGVKKRKTEKKNQKSRT